MPAFIVVNIAEVKDAEAYARYRQAVSDGIARAGGKYLVRGGALEVLEGAWRPGRFVVVEFETAGAAREWWNGPDYAPLRKLRQQSTRSEMILVEGTPSAEART